MQDVYRRIERVAPTTASAFITGESGSGKEVVADTIHRCSEQQGDAEFLAEHFLEQMNQASGARKALSRSATATVRTYGWTGNVRELKNAVQRTHIMSDDVVELDFIESEFAMPAGGYLRAPVGTPLADIERQAIYSTLRICGGNKRRCAEMLGVSLKTLYNRLADVESVPVALATS